MATGRLPVHNAVPRLGEDDRLDRMLGYLRAKAPAPTPAADAAPDVGPRSDKGRPRSSAGGGSEASFSVKSELAQGLREVKGRIKGLEDRLTSKKKALVAGP